MLHLFQSIGQKCEYVLVSVEIENTTNQKCPVTQISNRAFLIVD